MNNQLLQAAKHALEFIQSIDGYENGKTANELRQAIEAAEQERAVDLPNKSRLLSCYDDFLDLPEESLPKSANH